MNKYQISAYAAGQLKQGTSITNLLNDHPWLAVVRFSDGKTLLDISREYGRYYSESEILYLIIHKFHTLDQITPL